MALHLNLEFGVVVSESAPTGNGVGMVQKRWLCPGCYTGTSFAFWEAGVQSVCFSFEYADGIIVQQAGSVREDAATL